MNSLRHLSSCSSFTSRRNACAVKNVTLLRRLRCSAGDEFGEKDEEEDGLAPGKPMRIERLLANLGYGVRKEAQDFIRRGRARRKDGTKLKIGEKVLHSEVLMDEEPLDRPFPITLLLHKPVGYVVTSPDDERIPDPKVYDLLPNRFGRRRPFLACVGRLDKATSGLLILSDNGQLVQRINSPRKGIWKKYEVILSSPLLDKDAEAAIKRFASGTMVLQGENDQDSKPLLPARLEINDLDPRKANVLIQEGRYHQIRRMFSAIGHEVVKLHRASSGGLSLGELASGEWKYLEEGEIDMIFNGPSAEEVLGSK